ncbi:MAG: hypothetical protein OXG60_18075 [Chloroflexi bacterium]|nr:hypothetical protein [Chloroflexota bacterium]
MLISLAAILPISLAALIAYSALQMYGIAYDIPQLVSGTEQTEWTTWILPGFALAIAGGIPSTAAARNRRRSLPRSQKITSHVFARARRFVKQGFLRKARRRGELAARPKVKNSEVHAHGSEIRYDTNVMRWLDSLSRTERDLLRQLLAKSRLAIRHDGVLIAREQAEMMQKIEEFVLL